MAPTLAQAVAQLTHNVRMVQSALEFLTETALAAGDTNVAEDLAQKAADLGFVIPQLAKLTSVPEDTRPLPALSATPTREERGMRLVYLEALKLLETSRRLQLTMGSGGNGNAVDNLVALMGSLLSRVRSLCYLAVDELAEVAGS
jgi:hypothetical protein